MMTTTMIDDNRTIARVRVRVYDSTSEEGAEGEGEGEEGVSIIMSPVPSKKS